MRVRWTTVAEGDLSRIVKYIRSDNPAAARRMAERIFQGVATLRDFPHSGRIGLAEDTRELIFSPYIAVYEIVGDQVHVLRIRHAAQDWP